jgi:hypothetical protein
MAKLNHWQAAREAVALGATMKHAAETYGLSYEALRKRAERESWPKPEQIAAALPQSAIVTASQTWQQKGEAHRAQIFAMTQRALSAISDTPPDLLNWSDIERASRLADRAAGLDQAAPLVSLTFPPARSTEAPGFMDI